MQQQQQQQQQQQHKKEEDEDDEDDENDESCLADMGFLFEGSRASTLQRFEWDLDVVKVNHRPSHRKVRVALEVVDDEPGAVISGHYLWPAAPALAQHLVNCHNNINNDNDIVSSIPPKNVHTILELGAGCALASLVALQVFAPSLQRLVVTDHDPGTLRRAQDNYETTMRELLQRSDKVCDDGDESADNDNDIQQRISSIPVFWEMLSWGDTKAIRNLLTKVSTATATATTVIIGSSDDDDDDDNNNNTNHNNNNNNSDDSPVLFDLLLGSDLIYCRQVIHPLLETACALMNPNNARFWLSQSFPFDESSEQEIELVCEKLGLHRSILCDSLSPNNNGGGTNNNNGVRIQEFVLKTM